MLSQSRFLTWRWVAEDLFSDGSQLLLLLGGCDARPCRAPDGGTNEVPAGPQALSTPERDYRFC